jgi:copper homeostasis protein
LGKAAGYNERKKEVTNMARILEVCVDSLASARAAIAGGADRLELCSALIAGGLTPYTELLAQIRQESDIPVRCLMRPRAGDFLYTQEEILMMAAQIRALAQAGADGFVIGCLTPDGYLDKAAMSPLIDACGGLGITLHRCIDVSADPEQTYLDAMSLGIDTVLTSGAAPSCTAGMETIRKLVALRDLHNGPEVLVGAGVNAGVIARFLTEIPGVRAFHMSGKTELESGMRFRRDGIPMGLPGLDEWHIQQTDPSAVRAALDVLTRG